MRWIGFIMIVLYGADAYGAPAEDHWGSASQASSPVDYVKAEALIETEQYADALPLLADLTKQQPGFADAWSLLGFAYRKTGDLERSGDAYRRALSLDPYHRGALEYQGELFLKMGNIKGAEGNLSRLKTLCSAGCEELDELALEIATWRAERGN